MHRTQLYIQDDMLSKVKTLAKSLNISASEFIRNAIAHEIEKEKKHDMKQFFETFEAIESFKDSDATTYVNELRSKSRLIHA